jgi:hypothetical protein
VIKISMMRFFLLAIILLCLLPKSYRQVQSNFALKAELDSMQMLDQKYRLALIANFKGQGDSLAQVYGIKKGDLNDYLWKLQNEIDSLNTVRIEQIIDHYGYPGVSLVGTPTNEVAFYIIQHSKVISKYLPIVKKAAEENQLHFSLYAMMLDRALMFQDKEQIYGTQGSGMSVKNPVTGKWEDLTFIWPIKDPLGVNDRRKTAGFSQTIEENAESLGIQYKVFTLDEILRLREKAMKAEKD